MSEVPIILPDVIENFSVLWNTDCIGKTVLDIGADRGSTASHFLRNGAHFVTCVEGNPSKFVELEANVALLKRAKAIYKWISSSDDMTEVLWRNSADIVKIDIEGAEQYLLGVPDWAIRQHPEYMVEVHLRTISVEDVSHFFIQYGYDVWLGARAWLSDWQIIHCKKR